MIGDRNHFPRSGRARFKSVRVTTLHRRLLHFRLTGVCPIPGCNGETDRMVCKECWNALPSRVRHAMRIYGINELTNPKNWLNEAQLELNGDENGKQVTTGD